MPDALKANAKDELYGLQHGRFKVLKGIDRSYPICRLHGRPVSVRPRFLVKRHPLRLLMDYGEGIRFNLVRFRLMVLKPLVASALYKYVNRLRYLWHNA